MSIIETLESMEQKHPNTIPVLGFCRFAVNSADNLSDFIQFIPNVAFNARFYNYDMGIANALRTFCHLCFVDPMLVEVYLGMTFEEVEELYNV